ncbi:hypothetical protein OSTOST_09919, partial [Ostertagia ostertagi]
MECHSIFSPSTSRNANLRKRRQRPYSSVPNEITEEVTEATPGMQIPVGVDANRHTAIQYHREEVPHAYISEVARRYAEKIRKSCCSNVAAFTNIHQWKARVVPSTLTQLATSEGTYSSIGFENESTSLPLIKQRLRRLIGECDIERITCCVPMCGRVFNSVQVLAWHMSYSHHDLGLKSTYGNLCFVCGIRMDSAKVRDSSLGS